MNIYEKMSAITTDLEVVAKNLSVGYGKNSYKAVGEADVLAAVKPLERKYKVYSYPLSRKVIDTDILTNEKEYDGKTSVSKQLFVRIETVYRFVNIEEPTEYIDIVTYGDGVDPQDKAPGKAMTYGDKYALLKAYKIITGDDPDQFKSGNLKETKNATPKERAKASYPDNQTMIEFCKANYDAENQKKILDYYKADSFEALTDTALQSAYARKWKQIYGSKGETA